MSNDSDTHKGWPPRRPQDSNTQDASTLDDDPLVQLARIVSRKDGEGEGAPRDDALYADLESDLERELREKFEAESLQGQGISHSNHEHDDVSAGQGEVGYDQVESADSDYAFHPTSSEDSFSDSQESDTHSFHDSPHDQTYHDSLYGDAQANPYQEPELYASTSPFEPDVEPHHGDAVIDDRYQESLESVYAEAGAGAGMAAASEAARAMDGGFSQEADQPRVEKKSASKKGLLIAACVLGVLLLGSTALFMGNQDDIGDDGDAPLTITADNAPLKERPDTPEETSAQPGDAVFDTIEKTQKDTQIGSSDNPRVVLPPLSDDSLHTQDNLPLDQNTAPTVLPSDRVNAIPEPRAVRTVTVRPDGTIIDNRGAESASPNIAEQNVNVQPSDNISNTTSSQNGLDVAQSILNGAGNAAEETVNQAENTVRDAVNDAVDTAGNLGRQLSESARQSGQNTLETLGVPQRDNALGSVPMPPIRANNVPSERGVEQREAAQALTQNEAQPASQTPANQVRRSGNFVVQLASQRSRQDALDTFKGLQNRFTLLQGETPDIQSVDLGDRGIYYRLRVGPFEGRSNANDFCSRYKAAGGDCIVQRR